MLKLQALSGDAHFLVLSLSLFFSHLFSASRPESLPPLSLSPFTLLRFWPYRLRNSRCPSRGLSRRGGWRRQSWLLGCFCNVFFCKVVIHTKGILLEILEVSMLLSCCDLQVCFPPCFIIFCFLPGLERWPLTFWPHPQLSDLILHLPLGQLQGCRQPSTRDFWWRRNSTFDRLLHLWCYLFRNQFPWGLSLRCHNRELLFQGFNSFRSSWMIVWGEASRSFHIKSMDCRSSLISLPIKLSSIIGSTGSGGWARLQSILIWWNS